MTKHTKLKPFNDLSGKTYGVVTVLNREDNIMDGSGVNRLQYKVRCQCGMEWITQGRYLTRNLVNACTKKLCKTLAKIDKE